MKKLIAVLCGICIVVFSLSACGGGDSVKAAVPDIASSVQAAAGIENPLAVTDDDMLYTFALTVDNIDEYAGVYTGVTGSSGTVLVVKTKDVDATKAELTDYCARNADLLSNYPEFATAQQQAENGRVVAKGNVVVLAIAGPDVDYAAVDSAIEAALQ